MLSIDEFEEEYEDAINMINGKLGDYMGESSGWIMECITSVDLSIAKYTPIRGSSHIPTPTRIKGKQAIVNVKNKDQKCFLYSVLASVYPQKENPNRVSKYKNYLKTLNTKGIEMPMAVKDIDKFEKMNPEYNINVYGCDQDGSNIFPRRISKRRDKKAINLIMLENGGRETIMYV